MKKVTFILCVLAYAFLSFTPANAQWQPTGSMDSVTVNCIAGDSIALFAGTAAGMYVSLDSGATWLLSNNGLTNTTIYSIAINGNNIFAGTYNGGIFLSTNNGESWTSLSAQLLALDSGITSVPVYALAVSGNNVYAGTFGKGIILTNNNGTSWVKVNNGLRDTSILSLAVIGTNVFAGTSGYGMYISADTGAIWNPIDSGLTSAVINTLTVSGSNIFAATGTGVFMSSNNGISWTGINAGLTAFTAVYTLAAFGTNIFAGTPGAGAFLSANAGASWAAADGGLPSPYIPALAVVGNTIYAGTQGDGVWKQSISGILAVNNIVNTFGFTIYPNPVSNQLAIHISSSAGMSNSVVSIINMLGEVTSPPTSLQGRGENPTIDVSRLSAGIYFIQLKSQAGTAVTRFVKE